MIGPEDDFIFQEGEGSFIGAMLRVVLGHPRAFLELPTRRPGRNSSSSMILGQAKYQVWDTCTLGTLAATEVTEWHDPSLGRSECDRIRLKITFLCHVPPVAHWNPSG
jgi:hypothetical protein